MYLFDVSLVELYMEIIGQHQNIQWNSDRQRNLSFSIALSIYESIDTIKQHK